VKVGDEVGELRLRECLEVLDGGCCDDKGGVIGVRVYFGVGDGADYVIYVEEEEGGGKCAALWDAVRDGLEL
jgi:hypothetical protein